MVEVYTVVVMVDQERGKGDRRKNTIDWEKEKIEETHCHN